ncbi:MAG TPA: hypothetical protein VJ124_16605 [Pyrinomonadaceae bacterium]|nr:hypothetical protein [Pyrinomonadaceae bacterium]
MNYHYTWEFGRHFDFIVGWLHRVNFFYFYFYVPLITLLAIALFCWVLIRVRRTGYLTGQSRLARFLWYSVHSIFCWIAVGAFAVAIKMLIVEELDYQERKWFEAYLTPGHLYISSAAFAYLAFIVKSKPTYFNLLLALYVQVALIAGYGVASYRVLNEDIEGALGGVVMLLFFAVCNYDLFKRVRSQFFVAIPAQRKAVVS